MTGSGQELYRVLEKRTLGLLDKLFWVIARSAWSAWKDSLILATPETEDDSLRLPGQPQGSPCLCRSKKLSVSSSASGCALLPSPAVWLVRIAMESAYCLKDSHPKLCRPPFGDGVGNEGCGSHCLCRNRRARIFGKFLANDSLSASPVSAKSANDRINTGDLWWAWVDLNHRPRPYQGRALAT
jgi:hypothetical protein